MDMHQLGRVFLLFGVVLAVVGGLLLAAGALGFGRLPGDLAWRRGNLRVYVPLVTSILLSIVLTVVLNVLFRR